MAPKKVTQEGVDEAAEALLAEGQEPTLRAVQERTKGSYSTVKRHLEVWQAQRKAAPPPIEPPPEVLAEAQRLATALWQVADSLASQRVTEVRAEAERAVAEARAGQREAETAIEQLEGELEQAAEAQEAAERLVEGLRTEVAGAQRAAERLRVALHRPSAVRSGQTTPSR